jgi:hypothetical protein
VRAATVTGNFFNVSNDTIALPGSWSNAHGAARPAIYRCLVNCARHGRPLQMQSICAVDRNTRRRFAEKGVGFPSPILSTAMITSLSTVKLKLSARTYRQSVDAIIPRLNNVH